MRALRALFALGLLLAMAGCGGGQPGGGDESIPEPPDVDVPDPAAGDEADTDPVISFARDVLPILEASCTSCHGQAGGLSLESHDVVLAGSEKGPVIVGGKPGDSPIVHYIEGTKEPRMPQGADPLTDEQITTIRTWILQGAAGD